MENEKIPLCEQELLYDPMFAKNPDDLITDDPTKGIFGKVIFKKLIFIVVLVFFICLSMYFSFRTVSKDVYTYTENGTLSDGSTTYVLSEYHGDTKQILELDYVRDENDIADETKTVNEVGRYAVNCNESLSFIYIADTVEVIDAKSFYTCKNLKAFFVDEDNPNYKSVDGVLYRLENGIPVEIMMFPPKNPEYMASLELGLKAPATKTEAEEYLNEFQKLTDEIASVASDKNRLQTLTEEKYSSYVIPETVTTVNELCFTECTLLKNITISSNVTDIETMAFFKCYNLQEINIPDSVITIGSDAFSYCQSAPDIFIPASVKSIGHHAFYDCSSVEAVRMECSEEEADNMDLGSAWLPERRKVVMRPIGVLYNEEREMK